MATLQDILSGNFPAARRYAEGYAQMPSYLQDPYLGLSTSNIGKVTQGLLGKAPEVVENAKGILDYGMQHRPAGREFGAPLHDLTGGGNIYPQDVYSSKAIQYYGDGTPLDIQSFSIAQRLKNKPDALVTIYRAIPNEPSIAEQIAKLEKDKAKYLKRGKLPSDAPISDGSKWYDFASEELDKLKSLPQTQAIKPEINPNDWVTINKQYAKEHGESALGGKYKIISKKVKAKDIFTSGDSIHEWGYDPEQVTQGLLK